MNRHIQISLHDSIEGIYYEAILPAFNFACSQPVNKTQNYTYYNLTDENC